MTVLTYISFLQLWAELSSLSRISSNYKQHIWTDVFHHTKSITFSGKWCLEIWITSCFITVNYLIIIPSFSFCSCVACSLVRTFPVTANLIKFVNSLKHSCDGIFVALNKNNHIYIKSIFLMCNMYIFHVLIPFIVF